MTRDEMMAAINDALYKDTQAGHMLPWKEVAALGDALHRRIAALATPAPVADAPADLVALVREYQDAERAWRLDEMSTSRQLRHRRHLASQALLAWQTPAASGNEGSIAAALWHAGQAALYYRLETLAKEDGKEAGLINEMRFKAVMHSQAARALGRIRGEANNDTGRSDAVAGTNDCPVQRREDGDPNALVGHGGGDGARRGAGPRDSLLVSGEFGRREAAGDAVTSRGECPTCGGVWPCSRCTTRAVDLDALKRSLIQTCAACRQPIAGAVVPAWDDEPLHEACAEPAALSAPRADAPADLVALLGKAQVSYREWVEFGMEAEGGAYDDMWRDVESLLAFPLPEVPK